MDDISANDLDHILKHSESSWKSLDGARFFLTGGTGLFGLWLLESMIHAQKKLGLQLDVTVLSRDPGNFLKLYPKFQQHNFLKFHQGDVVHFDFPKGSFTHVLHGAATSAKATFQNEDPLKKYNNLAEGTRRVLEFAEQAGVQNLLFTSSGSAYGKQPADMPLMLEDYQGAPEPLDANSALGQGKRAAEYLCSVYARKKIKEIKIVRCFSFVGPHLPLGIHYAIGNFIGNGLAKKPIYIRGDGKPVRSYLYMADLVIWLMTIFTKGQTLRLYNVGSEEAHSVADIAKKVAACFQLPVEFAEKIEAPPKTAASDRYVLSTARARTALGLKQRIDLDESIRRTIQFYQRRVSS